MSRSFSARFKSGELPIQLFTNPFWFPQACVTLSDGLVLQRICDDVPYFVHGSTDLMLGIARKVFGVIAFSGK